MHRSDRQDEARALAARPYIRFVFLDETTDDDTVYVALNPELPGCFAQGDTVPEAEEILAEVREDYIAHLLAHGLPVPEPRIGQPASRRRVESSFDYQIIDPGRDGADEPVEPSIEVMVFA